MAGFVAYAQVFMSPQRQLGGAPVTGALIQTLARVYRALPADGSGDSGRPSGSIGGPPSRHGGKANGSVNTLPSNRLTTMGLSHDNDPILLTTTGLSTLRTSGTRTTTSSVTASNT